MIMFDIILALDSYYRGILGWVFFNYYKYMLSNYIFILDGLLYIYYIIYMYYI